MYCFQICPLEKRGRECKFQNKAHRTFDITNNSTPAHRLGTILTDPSLSKHPFTRMFTETGHANKLPAAAVWGIQKSLSLRSPNAMN